MTNISKPVQPTDSISNLLNIIGQPARVQILLALGDQEACVCHLETVLGMRQASISQHLMTLRKAGLVSTQRDGRHIFYRLAEPAVLQVLQQAAAISGMTPETLDHYAIRPVPNCPCPHCSPDLEPELVCKPVR